jgi:hypothetical protein
MSILNQAFCATAFGNTGLDSCYFTLGKIARDFLVPRGFELTAADLADGETALAKLVELAKADSLTERIFPLPEIAAVTDSSEDAVFQTLGAGFQVPIRAGNYNILNQYLAGGNCMNNALQKFKNSSYRVIRLDEAGNLIGTKVGTSMKGIPLIFFFPYKFSFATDDAVAAFRYGIGFKPEYINESLGFIKLDFAGAMDIDGLHNAVLSLPTARVTNVIKVKVTTGCSGIDLYDEYSAALAVASNWIVTEAGANITVTSVAVDANLKAFTITLTAADPDYNVAGPFVVSMAAPSVLETNGLPGYEGISLKVA